MLNLIDYNDLMRGSEPVELYGFDDINESTVEGCDLGPDNTLLINEMYPKTTPRIASMDEFVIPDAVRGLLALSPKFVLAGGSVIGALRKGKYDDLDIFIISDSIDWKLIDMAVDYIRNSYQKVSIVMSKGLIQSNKGIQIILRCIPSIHHLLHGFDLPHCAFAYDGKRIYCTKLGIYCFIKQSVVVVPKYNSSTFIKRIIKYFVRGYNLILNGIDTDSDTIILCNYLSIIVKDGAATKINYLSSWIDKLNYIDVIMLDAIRRYSGQTSLYCKPSPIEHNSSDIIMPFLIFRLRVFLKYDSTQKTVREILEALNILPYNGTIDEFRLLAFKYVISIKNSSLKRKQSSNVILKMFDYHTIVNVINKKISFIKACDMVYKDYMESLDKPANFWIEDNPSGQFSMSKYPVILTAAEFYTTDNHTYSDGWVS
jgi:hypothetical protein